MNANAVGRKCSIVLEHADNEFYYVTGPTRIERRPFMVRIDTLLYCDLHYFYERIHVKWGYILDGL